jgi:pyruvate dehydrogenase E1 component alpha subunit
MLLEIQTYRYRGHSMSDPAKYRTKDEVQKMRAEHDPIDHVRAKLTERGVADDARLKEIDKQVKTAIAEAAEFAQNSPEPKLDELMTDIYAELVEIEPRPDDVTKHEKKAAGDTVPESPKL